MFAVQNRGLRAEVLVGTLEPEDIALHCDARRYDGETPGTWLLARAWVHRRAVILTAAKSLYPRVRMLALVYPEATHGRDEGALVELIDLTAVL